MRSRVTAIVLAFLFGMFGGHKFYLGQGGQGVLYLLFSWTGIPWLVSIVDIVILATMNQETFNAKFNTPWSMMHPQGGGTMAQNVTINLPPGLDYPAARGDLGSSKALQRDIAAQLSDLHNLRVAGVITEDEFQSQKTKLLTGP